MSAWDLKRFPVLSDLAEEERAGIASCLEERAVPPGETLFREGEEADSLVLLATGSLRLSSSRTTPDASGTVLPGASLGCLALFRVGTREATATAGDDTRVLVLSRSNYRRLADDHPRAACRLAESVLVQVAQCSRAALDAMKPADG